MSVKVTSSIDDKRPEKLEKAIEVALQSIGILMEGTAAQLAAVDTGRLRGSITWATSLKQDRVRGKAKYGDRVDRPNRSRVVHIGTNVEYAPHVEYGTRRMSAQPFLRPAFDTHRGDVKTIFDDTIKRMVIDG
jgi:HK97 gp10 family phage protein